VNRKLAFVLLCSLLFGQKLIAESWISIGIPTIYRFSEADNSPLSTGSDLKGTPSGYMIYGSIYEKPFLGYEKYQIKLSLDNSDEIPAIIDVEFYDIGLQFKQKYTSFLVGYGYGSVKTECQISSCSEVDFEEGIARQYFAQLAVVIYNKLSLHLSAHRVMGENGLTVNSSKSQLVLDGMQYAFGLKLGWR
jgi:hypothetical protein